MSLNADPNAPIPPIEPGASLLLAWRLASRPILLIGGGQVASSRLYFLLNSDAHVTLVSPFPLDPQVTHRIATSPSQMTHHARAYLGRSDPIQPRDFTLVFTAIDDNPVSEEVSRMCREQRVPVNVADVPPLCDFYFGAQFRRGPLQVLVSTGGMGPRVGAMIRDHIEKGLPGELEESIEGVGALRRDLRKRAPGVGGDLGRRRMEWMIGVCDEWGLEGVKRLREDEVRERVLEEGWEKGKILGPADFSGRSRWRSMVDSIPGMQSERGMGRAEGLAEGVALAAFVLLGLQWWTKRAAR